MILELHSLTRIRQLEEAAAKDKIKEKPHLQLNNIYSSTIFN
jgi:hypothetical protein